MGTEALASANKGVKALCLLADVNIESLSRVDRQETKVLMA